ncbi:hypothetical protein PILCRDRAFT_776323 [Piloderma croceum F 1598]|uniref:Uncharacterized protein n=1 Tax=Piloderma croceum (strain F 1598) TaxID=765440 RepID=A0A0C3G679_PILCF|nr:hypothetical protein PILCRDRAFT_776323 [Piloderma croceum F 1598]
MATRTSQRPSPSPFARLSRFGLGLGLKSEPSPTYSLATKDEGEEDWYIAYNGPYEVPKDTRKRDSWGDIVEDEGRDTILGTDVLRRYGGGGSKPSDMTDGMGYRRGRAQSATSRAATISSTIAPSRRSMRSPQRRPGSTRGPPVSSYINLDAAGGVGESPMPPQRSPISPTSTYPTTNRTSMANFFFGRTSSSSSRKSLRSPSTTNLVKHRESRATSPSIRKSTSLDMSHPKNQGPAMTITTRTKQSEEEDYYNSYYSTLIPTPKSVSRSRDERHITDDGRLDPESTQGTNLPAYSPDTQEHPPRAHPYSFAFPAHAAPPKTAPAIITRSITSPMLETQHDNKDSASSGSRQYHPYPLQTLVSPKPPSRIHLRVVDTLKPSNLSPLKGSVSVPNLRARQQASPPTSPHLPKGIERWLSAESWCDAMILPRPRFKIKHHEEIDSGSEKRDSGKSSGRIVSPPPTPIARSTDFGQDTDLNEKASFLEREEQVAPRSSPKLRRRLTKSKSAANLRSTHASNHPTPAITVSSVGHPKADSKGKGKLQKQKRRPKDLVLDDLAFQGEPSLDRVLDEGDQLDEERKQWHAQATKSLGNKATRSLSRGRSKSLNHKDSRRHRRDPSYGMGNIDFLTTRTLLGSQGVAPTIIVRPPGSQETRTQSGSGTMSSKCHSHTTSHATQSSQGAHRRNDSWGQHALKLAKYTASGALCGIQDQSQTSPMDEKGTAIEGAIKATDTKVIQLHKQRDSLEKEEFIVIEKALPDYAAPVPDGTEDLAMGPRDKNGASPTPSGTTGRGVGIALSTPPPSDDHSQETYESMSIPDHPYAQGARYSHHPHRPTTLDFSHERIARGSDFAGPHPSSPEMTPLDFNVGANDMSMRHRFPPQANLQSLPHMAHPYAMGSYPAELHTNPEGLVDLDEDEPRDTNFEFAASSERLEHAYARMSTGNQEPLEVGEALTSFRRQGSRDTVFGLGEQPIEQSQPTTEPVETRRTSITSQTWPLRIRRKPVSYADYEDISPASPAEATTPSSEHLNAPKYRREASSSTVGHSSGSSPQHSPRPLGNVDDLEHFHDLFYKPDQSNPEASATSSLASHKAAPSDASHEIFSVEVGSSRSLRSGLSKLARKLTEEYEGTLAQEVPNDVDAFAQDQRGDSLRGQRVADIIADREFIFSDPSKPRRVSSPEPMDSTLPLRLNNEETGPDDDVPEDVESSRASSILERSSIEDDTFVLNLTPLSGLSLRLRAVEAVTTPPAVVHDHRDLRPVSLIADKVEPSEASNTEEEHQRVTSRGSLAPPIISTDPTRSSYMTSTTDGSRMSGLSDFPEPPSVDHLTPAHMSIISSYFGGDISQKQREEALSTDNAENRRHANRMTFGGSEDMEKSDEVVPPSTDV